MEVVSSYVNVDSSELCKSTSMGPVLFPERLSTTGLLDLCHQVNGKVFLIKDSETLQKANSLKQRLSELNIYQSHCDGKHLKLNTKKDLMDS